MYKLNVIANKSSQRPSADIGKITIKFIWKGKGTRIVKTILTKKNKMRCI